MIHISYEAPDELCHRISAGGDLNKQYAIIRVKAGHPKDEVVKIIRKILHEIEPKTGIIRVQFKNDSYLEMTLRALQDFGYDILENNKNGDCLYIWTNGSKKAYLSHATSDNPYLQIDESNFKWFINCL